MDGVEWMRAVGGSATGGAADDLRRLTPRDLSLLIELTRKEVRLRYNNSYLGYLWSIMNPLVLALVFVVAFQVIMRLKVENYALFLVSGLFAWQWFANSIQSSANAYFFNRDLVKKVAFPREFLPLASILNDTLHFIAALPVVLVLVLAYDRAPTLAWIYGIPLLIVAQLGVTFGLALVVGGGNVFFRDLERLAGILILILFYLTPVIYPADMIPEQYRFVFAVNPMYHLVTGFRTLFVEGVVAWYSVLGAYLTAGVVLTIGVAVHRRLEWQIPEAL